MTKHDDEIPDPDTEPTAAEKASARAFGELVDRVIAGRGAPAAMSPDDRALVEVATVIRGASGKLELDPDRASSLIDAALVAAVDKDRPRSASLPPPIATPPNLRGDAPLISFDRAGRRFVRRFVPLAIGIAAAAAAAIIGFETGADRQRAPRPIEHRAPLAETLRSRPADDLVGVITRDRDGDAATRIDAIYADRLDGYRELSLRHAKGGAR